MSDLSDLRSGAGTPGTGPVVLPLAAGRLHLRAQAPTVDPELQGVATTIVGHVLGPAAAPCVALVGDSLELDVLASALAAALGRLPETHPRVPWGVLATSAGQKEATTVQQVVADAGGAVVVCYDLHRGDFQVADVLRETCERHGAGLVLVETSTGWSTVVGAELHQLLPVETAVVRVPGATGGSALERALGDYARRLAEFHGVPVPDAVVRAAADHRSSLPEPPVRLLPGRHLDRLLAGRARLRYWVAQQVVGASRDRPAHVDDLTERLRTVVVGQDAAVTAVSRHVRLGLAGLRLRADRPSTAVLLTGSTGTGKTLLATTLAQTLHVPLLRVDLAAYTEPHQIATLLGSPPGYVGSRDQENWLTTRIAANSGAVLLLDELDKATPALWAPLLMELLGAGTLTDQQGRTVDCRHLHVLLTANTGARDLTRAPAGFGQRTAADDTDRAVATVRALLPDELFNRLDEVVVLRPIDGPTAARLLDTAWVELVARLAPLGYRVRATEAARRQLVTLSVRPEDGARRLHRTLERLVLGPVVDAPPGDYVVVRAGGGVRVRRDTAADARRPR
ncbi:ATPase AAA-2 domain protein [Cellulomonas flavigena DSM 20109]|uniref:ATPase AAA-2 domain protein n=1 Tax=Cellulomonas flavigena (strain ATCC 482 / DSM 20109 / BCRC 11376 / JCM 18109 / NBRC 3775 / NCIMB 8073 / NRS 134) TaxID=446466 RepID=D5UDD4_CELFN|nr:AAA family ATPase [Cellulomonas flavigena]ADG76390.1 ATPase AAA-2 domain protein [Cellulomonas flavigena DSM 20109]